MLKIKELRMEKQITQFELGKILGVKNYTIGNWEQGRAEPSLEEIVILANYFGCTTDELLGREPVEPVIQNSIKITPLARRLLDAFYQMEEGDQNKFVNMAEAVAVMS